MIKHFYVYLPVVIGGMLSIGHATAENYRYNQNQYPDYYMNPNNPQTPYEYNYYDRSYRSDEKSEAYPSSTYRYEEPRVFTQFDDQRYAPSEKNQPNQQMRNDKNNTKQESSNNEGNVYRNSALNQSAANYRPKILTEEELLSQINNDSRTEYFKMNIDGRITARQLAAQSNYPDKNQAVKDAANKQPNGQKSTQADNSNTKKQNTWLKSTSTKF